VNRKELIEYITETYDSNAEFPWVRYPDYIVFRHSSNQKWFALVMTVVKEKLGLSGSGTLDILNVKCDPIMITSLREELGFYPAYHMSKANWISIILDGSVSDDIIKLQLDISFDLTDSKIRKSKSH
jgi:Uncharacterized protein conserved in bacteria